MPDFLDVLAHDAKRSIEAGYYEITTNVSTPSASLRGSILQSKNAAIISEIKFASPSAGIIREDRDLSSVARDMEEGGAVGISILTEPKHFNGHIGFIAEVRDLVKIPILMKDIIIGSVQIEAASRVGANAVLLIDTLFERGYCEKDVQSMIGYSHSRGLEALLEVHNEEEFLTASETDADIIGINNRDLRTLKVDLDLTKHILTSHPRRGKVIVSESGINSPENIRFLRECGAQAFLVGSAIMRAGNIKEKVKELANAS